MASILACVLKLGKKSPLISRCSCVRETPEALANDVTEKPLRLIASARALGEVQLIMAAILVPFMIPDKPVYGSIVPSRIV